MQAKKLANVQFPGVSSPCTNIPVIYPDRLLDFLVSCSAFTLTSAARVLRFVS
jgi:hypothetical protein